jgi:hypothetical protein
VFAIRTFLLFFVLNTASGDFSSTEIIPSRVASLVKISFDDAVDFMIVHSRI